MVVMGVFIRFAGMMGEGRNALQPVMFSRGRDFPEKFRRSLDRSLRIEGAEMPGDCGQSFRIFHQIGFRQNDAVGQHDLVPCLVEAAKNVACPGRIENRDQAAEGQAAADLRCCHDRREDRKRIGKPCRFDDDRSRCGIARQQARERIDQLSAHGAAQAAVCEFDHAVSDVFDKMMIERDFAEFVDDDGRTGKRRLLEHGIEQGGFAAAEKAGQHQDGDCGFSGGLRLHSAGLLNRACRRAANRNGNGPT